MSENITQILLIEDNPGDVRLIEEMLAEVSAFLYKIELADRLSTGLDCIARRQFDVILLDLGLPDSQGIDTVTKVRAQTSSHVPIIVLTGLDDEATAMEAVRRGAQDYLVKRSVHSKVLWRVIRYALERHNLTGALRISEEHYRTLVENANEAIIVAQDGLLKFVNPKAIEITGYSEEELASKSFVELIHPDDRDIVLDRHSKRLHGEMPPEVYSFRIIDKQGHTKWMEINAVLISWEDKPATLNFLTDITERKRIEEQAFLSSKLASIGELAAGVAHEINNPLTGVIGYAQLLMERQDVSQDVKEDLKKVYEESQRAVKIVQNLLSFARQHKPQKSHTNINELIERTLALRNYELKTGNITVRTNLAKGMPMTLADYNQLQQVILNIIVNAEQSIAEAKRRGKIDIQTCAVRDCIRITIADNGFGIATEDITKVFDPFFTTKPTGTGSGLGLSICHGIITEHGGNIYATSTKGKGASFTIELPITTEAAAMIKEEMTADEMRQRPEQKAQIKILVVEDESAIRTILTRILSTSGYQVESVADGRAALERIEQNIYYDLLIVDLKMPGMSGGELYESLKKTYPDLEEKVVFITGDVITVETRDFLASTGRPHLAKPFNSREIIETIDKALAIRHSEKDVRKAGM